MIYFQNFNKNGSNSFVYLQYMIIMILYFCKGKEKKKGEKEEFGGREKESIFIKL